jgi:hypothetical protein
MFARRAFFASIAVSLLSIEALAQTISVRGTAVSAVDNTPLADAIIRSMVGSGMPARTNAAGAFLLDVPSLPARIVAARIGFGPETLMVNDSSGARFRLQPAPLALSPSLISAERAYSAASSSVIRSFDIRLRPRDSSQELLRLAPGLVIAQHAGGGKAEQLYLRGFDGDHGTDVAISVDGIPVNMVTHAHGQGYADLHWLMAEVVEGADVRKGPFDARDGDFATAGSVSFRTMDRVPAARLSTRAGSFGLRHATGLAPFGGDAGRPGGYLAASMQLGDGPFLSPQHHQRVNAFAKGTAPLGGVELVATASAFDATWDASGQVPDRAVQSGVISRFGAVDDTEGGATSRYDLAIGARSSGAGPSHWDARVFATKYTFDLFSNFTYFLVDSMNGDGIEQVDDRVMLGAFASWGRSARLLGRHGLVSVGVGTRNDDGDVVLHSQRERQRLDTRIDVHSRQNHLYQWTRFETALSPRVRADVGLRADLLRFEIHDRILPEANGGLPPGSGSRWQGIVSPRLNIAFDASQGLQWFANVGTGFHSNDGRDVILADGSETVLPRAVSAELGARRTWTGGTMAVAGWWLDLESETVFVGDEGTTESSGRTRRVGVDVELRQQIFQKLWFDGDLNLARGRFRDEPPGSNLIPLAPSRTGTAGLTVRDDAMDGGLRVRHIGGRAANEDNSVRAIGSTTWELFGGWNAGPIRVFGTVDNLFNARWNEAQFATTSQLRGERMPVTELHYTPGAPRGISIGFDWRFQ